MNIQALKRIRTQQQQTYALGRTTTGIAFQLRLAKYFCFRGLPDSKFLTTEVGQSSSTFFVVNVLFRILKVHWLNSVLIRDPYTVFLCIHINTASKISSYSVYNTGYSSWLKRLEHKTDHTSSPSAEVKNDWSYTSTFPHAFTGTIISTYPHIRLAFHSLQAASVCGESAAICWRAHQLFSAAASVIRVALGAARSVDCAADRWQWGWEGARTQLQVTQLTRCVTSRAPSKQSGCQEHL